MLRHLLYEGRATSFAVSFVVAMNRVDVLALNTIFAWRLSKTRRTVGRTDSRLDGWSVHTNDWSGKRAGLRYWPFPFYPIRFLTAPLDLRANGQPPYKTL